MYVHAKCHLALIHCWSKFFSFTLHSTALWFYRDISRPISVKQDNIEPSLPRPSAPFPFSFVVLRSWPGGVRSPQPEARSRNRCNYTLSFGSGWTLLKLWSFFLSSIIFGSFFVEGRGGKTQRQVSTSSGAARTDGRAQAMTNLQQHQLPKTSQSSLTGKSKG